MDYSTSSSVSVRSSGHKLPVHPSSSSLATETVLDTASIVSDTYLPADELCYEAFSGCDDGTWPRNGRPARLAVRSVTPSAPHADGRAPADAQPLEPSISRQDVMSMIRHHMATEQGMQPPWRFLDAHGALLPAAAGVASPPGEHLTPGIRMIVVSWMVEVAEEFRLQQETLHLSICLLDRFLGSTQDVPRCVLQLLAVTCTMLASKHNEVLQPSVEQLCAVSAHHFQPVDLLRMERIVLDVLSFSLATPSSYTFLHLLAQAASGCVTPGVLSLAMYLCELAVLEYDMAAFAHSTRASAALLLAQLSKGTPQHTAAVASLVLGAGLEPASLTCCMAALLRLQQAAFSFNLSAASCGNVAPAAGGAGDEVGALLAPIRAKFGAACWCEATAMLPLAAVPAEEHWASF